MRKEALKIKAKKERSFHQWYCPERPAFDDRIMSGLIQKQIEVYKMLRHSTKYKTLTPLGIWYRKRKPKWPHEVCHGNEIEKTFFINFQKMIGMGNRYRIYRSLPMGTDGNEDERCQVVYREHLAGDNPGGYQEFKIIQSQNHRCVKTTWVCAKSDIEVAKN